MEAVIRNAQSTVLPEKRFNNFNDWAENVLHGCKAKKHDLIAMEMERLQKEKSEN